MKTIRLRWVLAPAFFLVALTAIAPLTWYVSSTIKTFHVNQTKISLETDARIIANAISLANSPGNTEQTDVFCKSIGKHTNIRITIIDTKGTVTGDSAEDPRRMDNHSRRPEIIDAIKNGIGTSIRPSETIGKRLMYVGIPLIQEGRVAGVVRVAKPLTEIDHTINLFKRKIFIAGIFLGAVALALGLFTAASISRPLETLKQAAERFSRGDMSKIPPVNGMEETATLTDAMNRMAAELDRRMRAILMEQNERNAVLKGMAEGILVVNKEERIKHLNEAARKLLSIKTGEVEGKHIQEVIRHTDLLSFVSESLTASGISEAFFRLRNEKETHIRCKTADLKDEQGRKIGVIIVLSDITEIRRLENMRRDFVANVSHELRTPLTSIKGFTETLLDGAAENQEDLNRFLVIISKQVNQLSALIDDLMTLSSLEHESESSPVAFEKSSITDVLNTAGNTCLKAAEKKGIKININCPDNLKAVINTRLLQQAVVNLIDNAVKYSPSETIVAISAKEHNGFLEIDVTDQGPGIESKHINRIFERFYRVDKSRSRNLGGTGLGLAITRHIIMSHKGTLNVKSEPGKGSVFSIRIPTFPAHH